MAWASLLFVESLKDPKARQAQGNKDEITEEEQTGFLDLACDPIRGIGIELLRRKVSLVTAVVYSSTPRFRVPSGPELVGGPELLRLLVGAFISQQTKKGSLAQVDESKRIYMYASQDSKTGNCSAAVQFYWKHALERFSELPPAYSKDITPYADHQSISFVDLYNPGQSPTVDCVFITCQPKIEAQSKRTQPPGCTRFSIHPRTEL
ncbi:hypothetical protein Esti_005287 [Eimeria stiedai]